MCCEAPIERAMNSLVGAPRGASALPVSDRACGAAMQRMAKAGYRFEISPNSAMALRCYLEGKSLCLAGTPGVGKTMWFKALRDSGVAANPIEIYSLTEHGGDYEKTVVDEIRAFHDCELVVDDMGTESNWNGNRADDLLIRVMAARERSALRTHYTTNLTAAQIRARYDDRVRSRLRLCKFIPMTGHDNRTAGLTPETAALLAKCGDPRNWKLCAERCSQFVNGSCSLGRKVPPQVLNTSPEESCGVGAGIAYRPDYLEWKRAFNARFSREVESFIRSSAG